MPAPNWSVPDIFAFVYMFALADFIARSNLVTLCVCIAVTGCAPEVTCASRFRVG
jgi:hypothetical protein